MQLQTRLELASRSAQPGRRSFPHLICSASQEPPTAPLRRQTRTLLAFPSPPSNYRHSPKAFSHSAPDSDSRPTVEIPSLAAGNLPGLTSGRMVCKRSGPLRARVVGNPSTTPATRPQLGMGIDSAAQQWGADTQVRPDQCGKPLITRNYATTSYRAAVQCRPDPSPRPARSSGTGTPPGSWPRCPIRLAYPPAGAAPR